MVARDDAAFAEAGCRSRDIPCDTRRDEVNATGFSRYCAGSFGRQVARQNVPDERKTRLRASPAGSIGVSPARPAMPQAPIMYIM